MSEDAPFPKVSMPLRGKQPDARWMDRAICVGADDSLFFPEKGQSPDEAARICQHCPVQRECLDYARETGSVGIWGGLTEFERLPVEVQEKRKKDHVRYTTQDRARKKAAA